MNGMGWDWMERDRTGWNGVKLDRAEWNWVRSSESVYINVEITFFFLLLLTTISYCRVTIHSSIYLSIYVSIYKYTNGINLVTETGRELFIRSNCQADNEAILVYLLIHYAVHHTILCFLHSHNFLHLAPLQYYQKYYTEFSN